MVSWILDSKFGVFIDCIDNIPDTIHHVRVSNTIRSHNVVGGTPGKIAKCTSKANRWSNWTIGNILIVLFVHDITMRMDPSLLEEQTFNDGISKLLCKPFEGMILHTVCFPEVGWFKLSIDIFHLVSGASVCTNSSNSTIATTTLFLAPQNHFCCCQSSSLDSNTHTGAVRGIHDHAHYSFS